MCMACWVVITICAVYVVGIMSYCVNPCYLRGQYVPQYIAHVATVDKYILPRGQYGSRYVALIRIVHMVDAVSMWHHMLYWFVRFILSMNRGMLHHDMLYQYILSRVSHCIALMCHNMSCDKLLYVVRVYHLMLCQSMLSTTSSVCWHHVVLTSSICITICITIIVFHCGWMFKWYHSILLVIATSTFSWLLCTVLLWWLSCMFSYGTLWSHHIASYRIISHHIAPYQ
jgi:hypothetical protein